MKKTKTSARLSKARVYYVELRDEVATALVHLGREHGLRTTGQVVAFVCGWAVTQWSTTPDIPRPPATHE